MRTSSFRGVITPQHSLSLRRQAALLGIPLSSYYRSRKECPRRYSVVRAEIHRIHQEFPYYGYRRITQALRNQGHLINHKTVLKLMRQEGIRPIYARKKSSSAPLSQHKGYLLKDLPIQRPNQVWMTDITYIKTPQGFVYLSAIIDVYSRYITAWRMYTTMEEELCVDVLREAVQRHGIPEIINTDQGSQYTGIEWRKAVKDLKGTHISYDGKGRWADNIYIERFWRTIKQEHLKNEKYQSLKDLRQSIGNFIQKYNEERLHSGLNYCTPADVFQGKYPAPKVSLK